MIPSEGQILIRKVSSYLPPERWLLYKMHSYSQIYPMTDKKACQGNPTFLILYMQLFFLRISIWTHTLSLQLSFMSDRRLWRHFDDLETRFGIEVAKLVDGVTKLRDGLSDN
ncbi:MAG: hypothetical protein Ct9H300mP27_07690 [Chloroflexota bacterium]|nr:MAG: hypothetical protein Ct9H300mP27_07690 [Chloroflexota bacterium]